MTIASEPMSWQGEQSLCCVSRIQETHDTVTFILRPQHPLATHYQPGQFLMLNVQIDGKTHSRAYSLSSSPAQQGELAITVKRVAQGLVSNWLIDHFHIGDVVAALAPAGAFHLSASSAQKTLLLCSAGSGITPMMSMVRWLLAQPVSPEIWFLHSARTPADIIFHQELTALAESHPNFHLLLVLRETTSAFTCYQGRLNETLFNQLIPQLNHAEAYLCGPEDYMQNISAWLQNRDFPMTDCFQESFAAGQISADKNIAADTNSYSLSVPKFDANTDINTDETILDALESLDLPIIAGCRSGVCGACKCKVIDGRVQNISKKPSPLSDSQQQEGWVLACSSQATSDLTIEF